jgi:hypothetical protein
MPALLARRYSLDAHCRQWQYQYNLGHPMKRQSNTASHCIWYKLSFINREREFNPMRTFWYYRDVKLADLSVSTIINYAQRTGFEPTNSP